MTGKTTRLFMWMAAALWVAVSLVASCAGTARSAASDALPVVPPPEVQQRFNEFYLSSVVDRLAERYDSAAARLDSALQLQPDAPEALFDLGQLRLLTAGRFDTLQVAQGDSLLRRAVALAPHNKYYKETLGNYLAQRGDLAGATRLYEELAASEPANTDLHLVLLQLYEATEDYRGAIRTLDRLERLEGDNEEYTLERLRNFVALQDSAAAIETVSALCAEHPTNLRYRVILAETYLRSGGQTDRALEILDEVLVQEPDNSYAQLSYLNYYRSQGLDSLANATHRAIVLNSKTPADTRFILLHAYAVTSLREGGDTAAVLSLLDGALRLPEATPEVAELSAEYMSQVGLPLEALEPVMLRLKELDPTHPRARYALLQIYLNREAIDSIASLCRDSHIYLPEDLTFYYFEASSLGQLGRTAEMLDVLRRGTEKVTDDTDAQLASDLFALYGDALHEEGDEAAAFAAYDKAIGYYPDNLLCLNNYAYFLSLTGQRLDEAEEMSRRTIEAEPKSATYLDTYAWILFQSGLLQQAKIYIEQALLNADPEEDNTALFQHQAAIEEALAEQP